MGKISTLILLVVYALYAPAFGSHAHHGSRTLAQATAHGGPTTLNLGAR